MPPGYPFGSIVINLNVVTNGHRDTMDHKVCLVIVLGEHEGGELCLEEPGLVLPMKSGDIVLFQSCKITHFNLHYKGERASIVLHSDKALLPHVVDGHMWNSNTYKG